MDGDRTLLSPARRRADRARLADEVVDVLVIGGGVTGAGAALDAASRGLSVGLLEARDFASGTSSRSSKLIHGGLRYLEQLAFPLVREALQERSRLVRTIAPHLVTPLPFLLPLTAPVWQRAYYGAGVALYDGLGAAIGADRGIPAHRHLSKQATLEAFPGLRPDGVRGAIRYWDAQVDDARHTLAVVRTAAGYGARVLSSARVTGLLRDGDRPGRRRCVGVRAVGPHRRLVVRRARPQRHGRDRRLERRRRRDAGGVGAEPAGAGVQGRAPGRAAGGDRRRQRGAAPDGLILRTATSVLFVIPWGDRWIIGTTDTPWRLDRAHPAACSADIEYLLGQVNRVLTRPVTPDRIVGVYAGLRPLLAGESDETSRLSREHAVVAPVPGLVLVAGGKYTTYRVMAADAVDAATAALPGVAASRTAHLPLVGAHRWEEVRDTAAALAAASGLDEAAVERLLHRHGDRTADVLDLVRADPALGRPLEGAPGYLAAEVVHAVSAEGALHLDDVLTRRTRVSIETAHRGVDSAPGRRRADGRGARLGRRAHRPRGRALRRAGGRRAGVAADAGRHDRGRRPARRARRPGLRLTLTRGGWRHGRKAFPDPGLTRNVPERCGSSPTPSGTTPGVAGRSSPNCWDSRPRQSSRMPSSGWAPTPTSPASLDDGRPLDKAIALDPEALLGARVAERFGPRLPFLLKVLAADSPLSLQAHPSTEQAEAGFAAEEAAGIPHDDPTRTFKDRFHKPELILALTTFEALCGFRPVEGSLHCLAKLEVPELKPTIAALARGGLRAAIPQLLALEPERRAELVEAVAESASRFVAAQDPEFINTYRWAARLAAAYPGDPGVVISLMCNHLKLEPGEAVFLPAGNLHAYLSGAGIEVMASSDNVLRGGLTGKHVDLAALIEVLDFTDGRVPTLWPVPGPGGMRYPVPVEDFDLTRVPASASRSARSPRPARSWCCAPRARPCWPPPTVSSSCRRVGRRSSRPVRR